MILYVLYCFSESHSRKQAKAVSHIFTILVSVLLDSKVQTTKYIETAQIEEDTCASN